MFLGGVAREGIDGSHVEEMVLAGQIEEVARYCESDVLNIYRVWLVYELFRGSITAKVASTTRPSAAKLLTRDEARRIVVN